MNYSNLFLVKNVVKNDNVHKKCKKKTSYDLKTPKNDKKC